MTLPYYGTLLGPGEQRIINEETITVIAHLGGAANILGVLTVTEVPPATPHDVSAQAADVFTAEGQGQLIRTIYARSTGSDATGDGTLANPYRTFRRAMADVPMFLNNSRIVVDITGIGTELLNPLYSMPPISGSLTVTSDAAAANPLLVRLAALTVFAAPTVIDTITSGDVVSNTADPVTGFRTIVTTKVIPASYKGKIVLGSGTAQSGPILSVSGGNTIELAANMTFPLSITDPSAELKGADPSVSRGNAVQVSQVNARVKFAGMRLSTRGVGSFEQAVVAFGGGGLLDIEGCVCEGVSLSNIGAIQLARSYFVGSGGAATRSLDVSLVPGCSITNSLIEDFGAGFTISQTYLLMIQSASNVRLRSGGSGEEVTHVSFDVDLAEFRLAGGAGPALSPKRGMKGRIRKTRVKDASGDGIAIDTSAFKLETVDGFGNSGVGVRATNGTQAQISGMTITGTGGDFVVGSNPAGTWAGFPTNADEAATFTRLYS